MIQGNCYYFENVKKDFATSQENCQNIFSPDEGKLFEPTTIESYEEIFAVAKTTFGSGWLLTGFEKVDNDANLVEYSSTGTETNIQPWNQNDIKGSKKPYISVNVANSKYLSRSGTFKAYSVCEKVTSIVSPTSSSTPGSKFWLFSQGRR